MEKPKVDEEHIRHCMLLFFDQGSRATKAARVINELYGDVLSKNKCQRWFKKFASGDRNLKNAPKSGRPSKLDDELLKSLVESDPQQSIEELSKKIGSPWSTVQEHLKRIGLVNRMGMWIPRELVMDKGEECNDNIPDFAMSRGLNESMLQGIITQDEK